MLRYWAEQIATIQEARAEAQTQQTLHTQQQHHTPVADLFAQTRSPAEDDDLLSNADRDEDDEEDRAIARASEWTAFDASALDLDNLNLDSTSICCVITRPAAQLL